MRLLDLAPADRARASFMEASARALEGDLPGTVASLKTFLLQYPRDGNAPEARYLLGDDPAPACTARRRRWR